MRKSVQEFCLLTFPFLEGTCLLFLFVIGRVCVSDLKGDWLGRSVFASLSVGSVVLAFSLIFTQVSVC